MLCGNHVFILDYLNHSNSSEVTGTPLFSDLPLLGCSFFHCMQFYILHFLVNMYGCCENKILFCSVLFCKTNAYL